MKRRNCLLGMVLCFVLILSSAGMARSEVTSGSTILKSAVFLTDLVQLKNSTPGVYLDALSTTLNLKSAGCVIMMFSSEVATGASMRFQALVDGEVAEGEIPIFTADNDFLYYTHGMNWWKCNLAKGEHTIQIQFTASSGDSYVRKRTLTILYNK